MTFIYRFVCSLAKQKLFFFKNKTESNGLIVLKVYFSFILERGNVLVEQVCRVLGIGLQLVGNREARIVWQWDSWAHTARYLGPV